MKVKKEWNYNCVDEQIESLAAYILASAKSSLKIVEAMEEDLDYNWLEALKILSQTTMTYASLIQDKV